MCIPNIDTKIVSFFSMEINIVQVTPIRWGTSNIIVCRRANAVANIIELSARLAVDIRNAPDHRILRENEVYAFQSPKGTWFRGTLKFTRSDNIQVIQLLDTSGTIDYDYKISKARVIQNVGIRNLPFAEIKVFIYGLGPYSFNEEFKCVFNGLIRDQKTTAVIGLMEAKSKKINECFVGDILYTFRSQTMSFRDALIREGLAVPRRVHEPLNQRIFSKKALFMANQNRGGALDLGRNAALSQRSATLVPENTQTSQLEPANATKTPIPTFHDSIIGLDLGTDTAESLLVANQYVVRRIVGEGTVSSSYFVYIYTIIYIKILVLGTIS